jgi:2-oxoglutarate ferredoxin oxidoreductase subunit delta
MIETSKLLIYEDRCKGCGVCIARCPKKVLGFSKNLNKLGYYHVELQDEANCIQCKTCAISCPDVVIEVFKKE